jgi:hypothetical protein
LSIYMKYTQSTHSTHWEYIQNLLLTDALLPLEVGENREKMVRFV